MIEYIEREAVLAVLHNNPIGTWRGEPVYSEEINAAIDDVEDIPAKDVKPVQHGKWIEVAKMAGITVLKCSECGKEHPMLPSAFCRDCGAKMDGGTINGMD